jgi:hypothetical protein
METASLSLKLLSFYKGRIRSRRQCTDKGIRIDGNSSGRGSGSIDAWGARSTADERMWAKHSIGASCRRFLLGIRRGGCYRGHYSDGWLALTGLLL